MSSFSEGLALAEDLLTDHTNQGTEITAALVIEVLREDFAPSEIQSAATNWLSEYGVKMDAWLPAIHAVSQYGIAAA